MAVSARDFDFIRQYMVKHSGILLDEGKEYLVEARLSPVVQREGLSSIGDLIERLRSTTQNGLQKKVVEAMTTHETLFFRDLHPFETFRTAALPELLTRRAEERRLSIFCAACSSGQEPYSLAMLLHLHFPQLSAWSVRLLAGDLSTDVLQRARAGQYNQIEVNRGLPASYLVKYFERRGTEWQISDTVRNMVEYFPLNLADSWPALPLFDVIFMRNVLIYFGTETRRQILARARRQLRQDGYLVLGSSETTFSLDDSFERYPPARAGWYRFRRN